MSAELFLEEKPCKEFICFPFQLGCGSTALHFSEQFPPSHLLAISRAFAAWERRIILSGILRQRAHPCRRVMMCCNARHTLRLFPLSALTLPHHFLVCFIFSFPMLDLLQQIRIFFFLKPNSKHLFFNTTFDLARRSSSGDRLVTGAVK